MMCFNITVNIVYYVIEEVSRLGVLIEKEKQDINPINNFGFGMLL